ncbi:MAG TPA: hypothetical protein EYP64_06255 [Desulfarculaceae bacterium]|nr:hypothetical protein [Desulfarculaceae bacterium]
MTNFFMCFSYDCLTAGLSSDATMIMAIADYHGEYVCSSPIVIEERSDLMTMGRGTVRPLIKARSDLINININRFF